ncbi:MAG: hypothetical protein E6K91_07240 [Thaumarchaeota archaeon]|nr:MAG: hypothetical protein E6K91_07240 [Nitrososphaerota archaeon]
MISAIILFSILVTLAAMIDILPFKGSTLTLLIIALIAIIILVIFRFLITVIIVGIIVVLLLILIFGGIPVPSIH